MQATDSEGGTATALLAFVVIPENDPPVLQSTSATYDSSTRTYDGMSDAVESVALLVVREDQSTAVSGISVRDADLDMDGTYVFGGDSGSADAGIVEVTISASNGTVSLGMEVAASTILVGDGTDDRVLAFRASLAGANRALAGLTYRGSPDFYGTDDLVITVDDRGNSGWGALCVEGASRGVELGAEYTRCPQVS